MAERETIDLLDSDDDEPPAPPPAASASGKKDDAIELSDTEVEPEPTPAPSNSSGAGPSGTGASNAPVLIVDDDEPATKRQRGPGDAPPACTLCGEARFKGAAYTLGECSHRFCRSCIKQYVERKLRRLLPSEVGCPICAKTLTIKDVQSLSEGGHRPGAHAPPLQAPMHVPPQVAAMLARQGISPAQLHGVMGGSEGGSSSSAFARPEGTPVATKRLMKELQSIRKGDPESHGFDVSLPDDGDLYTWHASFFGFEKGSPLAKDLSHVPSRRIDLSVSFPSSYPAAPPYVRVLRPRFAFRTGHVTIGGSICTEMLTSSGWSSTMTVEAVLIGIRTNMLVGGARLDLRNKSDYSEMEAREAFNRMKREHGWY